MLLYVCVHNYVAHMPLSNSNNVFSGLYYHLVREKKKPFQASFAIKRGWLHSVVWLDVLTPYYQQFFRQFFA